MIVPNPQIAITQNDDGAILLNKKSGQYYRLNQLGREVFRRIHDGQDVPTIVSELQTEFPAARERIPADVETLIAGLRKANLVLDR